MLKQHLMRPNILSTRDTNIPLSLEEIRNWLFLKTATRVYQEALASHQIPLREELVKFSFGFLLEENSYQIMDTLPFEELEALMTTDILVAEGVRAIPEATNKSIFLLFPSTLLNHGFQLMPILISIRLNWDANLSEPYSKLLKTNKENKTVCYRQLIEHSIIEL